jgi:hypothetical protein
MGIGTFLVGAKADYVERKLGGARRAVVMETTLALREGVEEALAQNARCTRSTLEPAGAAVSPRARARATRSGEVEEICMRRSLPWRGAERCEAFAYICTHRTT